MDTKTISVTISDIHSDGPALAAACDLARREAAHLDVFCIGVDPVRYADMPSGSIMMMDGGHEEAATQSKALAVWAQSMLPADLDRHSVQSVVISQLGLDLTVARLSRYSDLVVAAKPSGKGHSAWQVAVLDAALFGSKGPVLIVPDAGCDLSKPAQRVMIAWNESDEALSAIRKSLPMLRAASHVDVVQVDPPHHSSERSDPGGAVSLYLSRHGVKAEVSILARSLPRVSDVLMRFAREQGVEAIVMGGYGHSRLREALLGGTTRDMLEKLTIPVLMAH